MVFREMPEWTPKPIVSAAATGVGPRALAGFCLSQRNSCSSLEHRFLALHRLEIAADSRWAPLRLERHAGPQEDGSGASSWRELELDSVSYLVPPWRSQCYGNEESALEPSRAWLPQLRCSAHHIKQARSLTRTLGQLLRVPEALALQLIHRRLCQARRWLSHDHRCCRSRVLPPWRMARTVGRF